VNRSTVTDGRRWERRRPNRIRTVLATGALLALPLVLGGGLRGPAYAEGTDLGGYEASATGAVVDMAPNTQGFSVTSPAIESQSPYGVATIRSGPVANALSSTFYPGDLEANMGSLLNEAGAPGVPNDPLVARAASPSGSQSVGSAPGPVMAARATNSGSVANADVGAMAIPGSLSVGSSTVTTTTALSAHAVTSTSTVVLHDVTLAGGLVRMQSLVSTAEASSDGSKATTSGSLTSTGVTAAGTQVVIDDHGLHAPGANAPGAGLPPQVTSALAAAGVTLVAAGSASTVSGAGGNRLTGGLVVTVPVPAVPGVVILPQASLTYGLGAADAAATATLAVGAASVASGSTGESTAVSEASTPTGSLALPGAPAPDFSSPPNPTQAAVAVGLPAGPGAVATAVAPFPGVGVVSSVSSLPVGGALGIMAAGGLMVFLVRRRILRFLDIVAGHL